MPPAGGWRQPLNGGPTSILTPLLDNIPDGDADVLVVLARVRLRGLAPAPIEQGLGGGHTRGRWGEFPAKPFGTTPADLSRWRGAGTTGTTYPSRRCGRPILFSCWCPALQPIRRPELLAAGGYPLGGTRPENVIGHGPNRRGAGPTNKEARVRFTCAWIVT